MDLQTDWNFVATNPEVNTFINCVFSDAQYGFGATTFTANMNNFISCQFLEHSWSCVYMDAGSSVNNFIGCRFEQGGVTNRTTIDVVNPTNLNFIGCYFEATSTNLLHETGSSNSTTFDKCHFTYGPSDAPYNIVSDGIVNLGNNNWYVEPTASCGLNITGINTTGTNNTSFGNNDLYFSYTPQHRKMVSKWITTPSSLQQNLLTFTRAGASGSTTNLQSITGVLTINFQTIESGGFAKTFSRMYQVLVSADGFSNMSASYNLFSSLDSASGATLTISTVSGATDTNLIIQAVLTGLTPSTEIVSALQWSFEYIQASTTVIDTIYPALAV
jgi:hypothetical protein